MNNKKKITALLCAALLVVSCFFALSSCGNKTPDTTDNTNSSGLSSSKKVTIRYLNFKPESAQYYHELAQAYEAQTGVKVVVDTAANNEYESTLMSKMATDEAPTLFQINGPRGLAAWRDYLAELSDTELYKHLTDKALALTSDGGVYGIPYVVEGYGIIYNQAITDKYFAMENRNTDFQSMDEINNFEKLSALVEDMQKNADALGIKGVFASTSLKSGEDWRWQSHLTNIPIYYEFQEKKADLTNDDDIDEIDFSYADNFKNIFDLYLNNSVIDKGAVGTKTVADSMAEFALGDCAMVQNGNWAWSQIAEVSGNTVKAQDIKYLPIYTGVDGEEKQGLCIGTENYYAINKTASEEKQKAAADFIYWLYSSDTGKDYVTNKFGFISPFDTFEADETPTDPLARQVLEWMDKEGIASIPWNFTLFPSQTFKTQLGSSLLKYAQGAKEWADVKSDASKSWEKEYDAIES